MWENTQIRAILDAFVVREDWPLPAYGLLVPALQATSICSEAAFAPYGPKREELKTALESYASCLASLDVLDSTNDRFFSGDSKLDGNYNRVLAISGAYLDSAPSDEDKVKVFVGTILTVVFVHAVVCYMTGVLLLLQSEEDEYPDEVRRNRFRVAAKSCDQSSSLFEALYEQLTELEAHAKAAAGGHLGSLVLHAALGLASEKFFRMVIDAASGKSPVLNHGSLERSAKSIYSCHDKAHHARDTIRARYSLGP
jgi:hypothetical protein